jgi:hypothetical protein
MYFELIATTIFLLTTWSRGNDELVVRVVQKENAIYRTVIRSVYESAVDIQGNSEVLAEIRSTGVKFPIQVSQAQTLVLVIETGLKRPTGEIPFSATLDSSVTIRDLNGLLSSAIFSPADTAVRMWGTYTKGTMNIDSVAVRKIDPRLADSLRNSIGQMMHSINFPDSALRVGESFSQKVPMNAILGITDVPVVGTATYTLRQFDTRLAYFDISQKFELTTESDRPEATMSLAGTGQLIFDRSVGQMTQWNTKTSIRMKTIPPDVRLSNVYILTKMDAEYELSVTVSERK